ncbi:retinitis pigmentosa 1-like 1 protein isoform X2 [Sparus aurata]|uniref:retinitis pigmentosa 1-like 1 protein isoform X2 n=1 Tax=Sparus aurata TaxID=8175 RepID=UPI0011C12193|nr:centromere protein T isoform X2 [Sparus aurata]
MDPTEDLSARVLLKNILSTETPRTPITRSASAAPSTSGTRRSSRGGNKDVVAQTPQDMLRRSMRHKIRESITRKSLPATKRRTASVVIKKINTPGQPSMLFDDGDTPRHILKNILLTEPVRSPVVHERAETEEPQQSSASSGTSSKRPSIELSGLDLPDITIGNAASIVMGLSRKRPRRSLNVTAFEKRLKGGEDVEEEIEEALDEQSSLSLSSSTSLSLKTPFVDVRTERKHLQRRVSNRRKITEEEFGAAVDKRQMGEVSTFVERGHNETTFSEGLTLGFSKLSEPDITTDILHCNTALYAQPDAMTANFSIVATQDKPTVMASQIQRQMMEEEEEEEEELMEAAQNMPGEVGSLYLFPTEEGVVEECQTEESSSHDATHGQHEDAAAMLQTSERDDTAESEEDKNRVEAQTKEENKEDGSADSQAEEEEEEEEEEGGVDSQPKEEVATKSQSEEEEVVLDSQTEEEEGAVDSQTEVLGAVKEEGDAVEYQIGQDDPAAGGLADSQTEDDEEEEGEVESQPEEDVATRSRSEEEEVVPDSQTEEEEKEEGAVESQTEESGAAEEEGDVVEYQSGQEDPSEGGLADSQAEDELDGVAEEEDDEPASEQLAPNFEHISRRSHYSAGGVMLVREAEGLSDATEAEWSDGKSKAHSAVDVHSSLEMGTHESGPHHTEIPDVAESSSQGQLDASRSEAEQDADKENSLRLSEEEAAQDSAEQEEEWEDGDDAEENEEVPSKTPAFVKQKRSFFHPDPLDSPVLKDVQASSTGDGLPASKPKKQMRKRERSEKKGGLPKSYLMSVFKHFAKTKVSADVYPVLQETMDKFFERVADDLETYALHAKRKTIEVEDAELLLKRQGYINDKVPVEVLIEKYLRMDQRKLLIPIATSGNVVIPKKRR